LFGSQSADIAVVLFTQKSIWSPVSEGGGIQLKDNNNKKQNQQPREVPPSEVKVGLCTHPHSTAGVCITILKTNFSLLILRLGNSFALIYT
jgi:hypothetical protein